ncbi:MAG TPA: flippase [Candidatus Saccharimonadales bacterium]|nr:flippase [Candidatus Saccharimonadales bacterium]
MTKIHNIAKNTSYLTLALVMQKIISFTYFTLLARYLGPEDLGKYYFAISFTTIFAIFIDLGFVNVLTREIAKDNAKANRFLGNVLGMKLPLAVFSMLAVFILINILHYDPLIKTLVYISGISMVLDSFTITFFSAARGFHNLKYESISSVVFQLIILIFGYGALILGGGLIPAIAAVALASLYNFIYSYSVIVHKLKISVKIFYDKPIIKNIISISWPFAVFAIFQRLYTYLDSVLLAFFAGNASVGLYQIAFKIIFALQFLPMAFTASLYPAMSSYWQNDRRQLAISFERALNYLTIISWPIILGIVLLADKIVLLFKAEFTEAVLPLQISMIALFFIFINFPVGSLLNACDRQKRNTFNMGLVTVVSVILNLILIPRFQVVGASITVLVTNILMFVLGVTVVSKIIDYHPAKNLIVFSKSLLAAGLMAAFIFFGKEHVHILILIPAGGILYFYFLYLFGGFKKDDVTGVLKSFKL